MRHPPLPCIPLDADTDAVIDACNRHPWNNNNVKLPGAGFLSSACMHIAIHSQEDRLFITGWYRTVYQAVRHPIGSTVWNQRCRAATALHCSFFALGFRQSIFFPSRARTLTVVLALAVFISQSLPLSSLSACIRPSSSPLALMLMHSQSGCPLSKMCTTRSSGRPKACMQMSSNCGAVQTPWNLLRGRTWV